MIDLELPTVYDALRERYAQAKASPVDYPVRHQVSEALSLAAQVMADYYTEELRASEEEWLNGFLYDAAKAAEAAALQAMADELVKIPQAVVDGKAPSGFLEASTDALRADVERTRPVGGQ